MSENETPAQWLDQRLEEETMNESGHAAGADEFCLSPVCAGRRCRDYQQGWAEGRCDLLNQELQEAQDRIKRLAGAIREEGASS
jgi:hypothetical protein